MGKGGGCAPSKKQKEAVVTGNTTAAPSALRGTTDTPKEPVDVAVSTAVVEKPSDGSLKVFIVFYSMYGHVESLAKRMKKGVDGIDGVEAVLYRVAETHSQEVLDKMHAPPKDESIPIITAADLEKADGVLFGFPTRYGTMAAQMKAFFDSTGGLWKEQKLAGKPAGFFVSTGTQGGGQETTAWTAITQLAHHGMLFVPIGYTFGAGMFNMEEVRGGSPYGAGVYAGDGSRQANETELSLAEHQGKYMASIVKRMLTSS